MKHYALYALFSLLVALPKGLRAEWYSPDRYQQLLGHGVDVEWWADDASLYGDCDWDLALDDYARAGIQHVRIIIDRPTFYEADYHRLHRQVDACLRHHIAPILAYRPLPPSYFGGARAYRRHLCNWWIGMAEQFRYHSGLLSFDLILEPDATLFSSYKALNNFYADCVEAIRLTNPYRIVFISPYAGSDPMYLHHLRLPRHHNGYVMAGWHFAPKVLPHMAHVFPNGHHRPVPPPPHHSAGFTIGDPRPAHRDIAPQPRPSQPSHQRPQSARPNAQPSRPNAQPSRQHAQPSRPNTQPSRSQTRPAVPPQSRGGRSTSPSQQENPQQKQNGHARQPRRR